MAEQTPVGIQRPQRWDEPLSPDMTEADVDHILKTPPFSQIDPGRFPATLPLRDLLLNDTRIVRYGAGDIVVRRGDYGSSAFFTLAGALRIEVDAGGISDAMLGRSTSHRRTFGTALAQLWRNTPWPEARRIATSGATADARVKSRRADRDDVRIFLQDVPGVLTQTSTLVGEPGQWFGLVAALGRTPHAATIFAEMNATLLEVRWQGLRDIRSRAPEIREHIDALYREQSLKTHLRETPMFAHLGEQELAEVAEQTEFITYGNFDWYGTYKSLISRSAAERLQAEPIIAEEGHYPNGVILIRSGFARVSQRYGSGHRTVRYLGRGQAYGFEEIASNWRSEREGGGTPSSPAAETTGAALVVMRGPGEGRQYVLREGKQYIGRGDDAHIAILHGSISRRHCALEARPGPGGWACRVRDSGSTNGTHVNGQRVTEGAVELEHGDQLALGEVMFRFVQLAGGREIAAPIRTELVRTGLVPLHQSGTVIRADRVPLQSTLRAIGYVDVLLVPTAVIERYVLPTTPPADLPPIIHEHAPAGAGPAPTDAAAKVGAGMLEFMVENRFINGTATMLIDLDRCTRCDDCVRACAATHDGNPRFLRHGLQVDHYMVANACMHCEDPVCMIGCPTGAIHRDALGGQVAINDATCIGCATCANSCPYENIRMVEIRDTQGRFLLDEQTHAPIRKATKCDLCREQLGGPACQRACPHDALQRVAMRELDTLGSWLHR